MSPDSLKQMVACGFIDNIVITCFHTHFTIMLIVKTPSTSQYLSFDDRKGNVKRFHTAKSLYSKIDEILNWPVNIDAPQFLDRFSVRFNITCSTSPDRSSSNEHGQLQLPV